MKSTIVIMALLLASPAWAEETLPLEFNSGTSGNWGSGTPPSNWHLLTKSQSGTVSLIKGLSEKECRFMENRAMGRPATEEEKRRDKEQFDQDWKDGSEFCAKRMDEQHHSGSHYMCQDGQLSGIWSDGYPVQPSDIVSAECFQ